jgi:hypothetical protein
MAQIERIIGPYEERHAVCEDHDPKATEVAKQVSATICSCLPGVTVEHVGSTAIPRCAGKGIVDLMLLYPEGQLPAVRDVLDALGFQRQTTRDPFPEDRPMRTGSVVYEGTTFLLHVHVIAASSLPLTSVPSKPSLPAASRTPWTTAFAKENLSSGRYGVTCALRRTATKPKRISG